MCRAAPLRVYEHAMKRRASPELLDSDCGTPAEVSDSLADLRLVNRWFGGVSTSAYLIAQVARKLGSDHLSVLEVAAASGDVPRAVQRKSKVDGLKLSYTLLDRAPTHLNGDRAVVGDALALPFRDSSFDVVSCGLFTHHLSPVQLVNFVDEALRVSRFAVLINDLVRNPLHLALVYAGFPLYRSRLSRHDGPASVRAAYTAAEMRECLRHTPASAVDISSHYLFRMGVIAWNKLPKPESRAEAA
jgi:hypothetical protein